MVCTVPEKAWHADMRTRNIFRLGTLGITCPLLFILVNVWERERCIPTNIYTSFQRELKKNRTHFLDSDSRQRTDFCWVSVPSCQFLIVSPSSYLHRPHSVDWAGSCLICYGQANVKRTHSLLPTCIPPSLSSTDKLFFEKHCTDKENGSRFHTFAFHIFKCLLLQGNKHRELMICWHCDCFNNEYLIITWLKKHPWITQWPPGGNNTIIR